MHMEAGSEDSDPHVKAQPPAPHSMAQPEVPKPDHTCSTELAKGPITMASGTNAIDGCVAQGPAWAERKMCKKEKNLSLISHTDKSTLPSPDLAEAVISPVKWGGFPSCWNGTGDPITPHRSWSHTHPLPGHRTHASAWRGQKEGVSSGSPSKC